MKKNCFLCPINQPGIGKVVSPRPCFPFKNIFFLWSEDFIQYILIISTYHYLFKYPPYLHVLHWFLLLITSWFQLVPLVCAWMWGHFWGLSNLLAEMSLKESDPSFFSHHSLSIAPLPSGGAWLMAPSFSCWRPYFLNCNYWSPPYCLVKQLLLKN